MIRVVLWSLLTAFFSGTCVHVWMTWRLMHLQDRLVNARGDAAYANEVADQLLSGGRFIRSYDPKLGKDTYKFKPPYRQMQRTKVDTTVQVEDDFYVTILEAIIDAISDFEITFDGEGADAVR